MIANSKLANFNKFLAVVLACTFVALIGVVAFYKGEEPVEAPAEGQETATIDALKPGTYGGIEFKTNDDVAAYYAKCYDNTKTLTASYKNSNGETETCYKLLGEEALSVTSLLVEGKSNAMLDNAVGPIVSGLFSAWAKGLPPNAGIRPESDKEGDLDFTKSLFTGEDIEACNVVENADGTITMEIQPKQAELSYKNADSQGKFFNVLGDITGVVASIDIVSFSQGDANENIKVVYSGGTGKITIDPKTNEIVSADYKMLVNVAITHANALGVIKDKSATLNIEYTNHFPATDAYLLEKNGLTRA